MTKPTSMALILLGILLDATACTSTDSANTKCGVIGCVSSPYLKAKGGTGLIGQPVAAAMATMGGAPTSSYQASDGIQTLTWSRVQQDETTGQLACSETLTVKGGLIVGYVADGHC